MTLSLKTEIPHYWRDCCSLCHHPIDEIVIDFPSLPVTEIYNDAFISEDFGCYDQSFSICPCCGNGQLNCVLQPSVLYSELYSFRTGGSMSEFGNTSFKHFIQRIIGNRKLDFILEIGCNDTWLLQQLTECADKLYGVDPAMKKNEAVLSKGNIQISGVFFNEFDTTQLEGNGIVISSHVLEHIERPREFISDLVHRFEPGTLFVFQFPGFDTLVTNSNFHQIFHHHINYVSEYSIRHLLKEFGCEIVSSATNESYWGSLQIAFRKGIPEKIITGKKFSIAEVRSAHKRFMDEMKVFESAILNTTGKIVGFGAGMQFPVLNYHVNDSLLKLKYIFDDAPSKDGLYYPNFPIQIRKPDVTETLANTTVAVTGINFIRTILKRILQYNPREILIPRIKI